MHLADRVLDLTLLPTRSWRAGDGFDEINAADAHVYSVTID
jgi:hypothetical protein